MTVESSSSRRRDMGRITPRGRSSSVCSQPSWSLACPSAASASLMSPEARRQGGEVSSPSSCSSSFRSCSSSCSGWCTSCRKRSRTSGTIRSSRPSDAVPAVARVRRAALAARLAVGVHQARRLQAGLRNRQASRLLQGARPAGAGKPHRRHPAARRPRSKGAACRPVSSTPFAADLAAIESRLAASDAGARWANGSPAARHLRVLRLADLHQVQAAAVDHAVEGRRRDLPGGRPGGDDAAAEHLRADDHRCQGRQVRRADRVAGARDG